MRAKMTCSRCSKATVDTVKRPDPKALHYALPWSAHRHWSQLAVPALSADQYVLLCTRCDRELRRRWLGAGKHGKQDKKSRCD